MGVPSFYRWLMNKYPKIVTDAVEEKGDQHLDCSLPNPNGLEFDNLYLDMNGIIHPCFHPEDNLFPPTTFEEVFCNIYNYVDRLFSIVRPRKLLYLAIDGVAPRAKMNQQRSRRFRAAKDSQIAEQMEEKLRNEYEMEGKVLLPKEESQVSDSNVITPGTEFMYSLSRNLESYIRQRMSDNVAWRNIKVILSDANVPGEGEHKIMSFIRAQRSSPEYEPNTRHCLYGLDADLIMLALATHEIHFSIIREDLLFPKEQTCHLSAIDHSIHKAESRSEKSSAWFEQKANCGESENLALQKEASYTIDKNLKKKSYQFVHIWILREYLCLDMEVTSPPETFRYDFERIVDDFILICFFAGNDFLPHIPCLEISEGAIDLLIHVYKKEFKNLGGYLVDIQRVEGKKGEYIKLKRLEKFIFVVGQYELQIFTKRSQLRERKLRLIITKNEEMIDGQDSDISQRLVFNKKGHENYNQKEHGRASNVPASADVDNVDLILKNTKELKQKVKNFLRDQSDLFKDGCLSTDKVKFGNMGWRERYYKEKFGSESPEEIETTRKDVVAKYGEGLCWVLLYYFFEVPSWTWFYPYHYGPFASDFKGLSQTKLMFEKGSPFKPLDQLMGVFPPKSVHALPVSYKRLMIDENSTIIDFYPTEFDTDIDGKRYTWQGICKLPFIDEKRLLVETTKLQDELKDDEKRRNLQNPDRLFMTISSKLGEQIISRHRKYSEEKNNCEIKLNNTQMGIDGTIRLVSEEPNADDEDKCAGNVMCLFYETHQYSLHVPRLLEHVDIPEKMITEDDITETKLWHEERGRSSGYRNNRFQNQSGPSKPIISIQRNSSPDAAAIYNGSGTGFLGRGKISYVPNNFPERVQMPPTPHAARQNMNWSPRTRDYRTDVYEYNERSKIASYGGIERLQISSAPNLRPQWVNKQPDAGPSNSNQYWRGRQQPNAPSNPNQDWRGNKQQPNLRPQWVNKQPDAGPSNSNQYWRGRQQPDAGPSNPNQDWRGNKQQPMGAPEWGSWKGFGRGQGFNVTKQSDKGRN